MFSSFQEDGNAIVSERFVWNFYFLFAHICIQPAGVMALSFNLVNIGGDDDEI